MPSRSLASSPSSSALVTGATSGVDPAVPLELAAYDAFPRPARATAMDIPLRLAAGSRVLGLAPSPAAIRPARLSSTATFYLLASIVVSFLAGSSAPTPLYARYQAEWGFTPITITLIFAVYALAVLASLLTVGSLSDHVGRRPVLLAAIALQTITMLVFASAQGVAALIVARILQGVSTGAAMGALGPACSTSPG